MVRVSSVCVWKKESVSLGVPLKHLPGDASQVLKCDEIPAKRAVAASPFRKSLREIAVFLSEIIPCSLKVLMALAFLLWCWWLLLFFIGIYKRILKHTYLWHNIK